MVDTSSIQKPMEYIGSKISSLTQKILEYMASVGIFTSAVTAKIISILILLVATWIVLHIFSSLRKPVRIGIIILAILLVLSIFIA